MKVTSIQSKISIAVVGIIIAFGIVTVLTTYSYTSNKLIDDKSVELKSSVSQIVLTIEESSLQAMNLAKSVASNPQIIFSLKQNVLHPEINQILSSYNSNKDYSAIYIINQSGIAVASSDLTFINQDYSFRPYFQNALKGQPFVDVSLGVTSKKLGYYFSTPVHDSDKNIIGVAVVKMIPDHFDGILNNSITDHMSDLVITDKYGVIISSVKQGRVFSSLGPISHVNKLEIARTKSYSDVDIKPLQYLPAQKIVEDKTPGINVREIWDQIDHEKESLYVSPIANTSFWLVSEVSNEDVQDAVAKVSAIISSIVFLTTIATMLSVYLIISRTLAPIKKIVNMADKVSKGEYDQPNPIKTDDELGDLGKSMEIMAASLKKRYVTLETQVAERTAEITRSNQDIKEQQQAILNILEDVEESKSDLEKFKLAVDNASDHIVITDPEGIVLYANKAVETVTGFSSDFVIGKKTGGKELWGGLMPLSFYQDFWKTIKTDKKTFTGEILNRRKNGSRYTVMASISPVLNDDEEVVYFVGIERDITREKEVDRMKTEFISLASHQLRTPLSAMKWFSEMLLAGDAGKLLPEQKEFVQNIYSSNERMIQLVKSLLNISRIEAGRIIIDPKPVSISKIINGVAKELEPQLKSKKQTITIDIVTTLKKIKLDEKLIWEVFKNLLTNASKYSGPKAKINISVTTKDNQLICQISDNGYGILPKDQPRIFEKFYRGENILKLETDGTGLGLYLTKAIIDSSGGKIWFKSILNKGTTFWISLPLSGSQAKAGEVEINR